ncbi:hypothetical protein [Catellatospora sp. NPDC049609]|uniref:hypothetical protein n=1 Tax=Catellatospora sp. NPDC049609 TaxID=3155505 RepID=UPI00342151F6
MRWFGPRCPVRPEEHAWLESSLTWLAAEFGRDPLKPPPVRPADLVPEGYAGGVQEARTLLDAVCVRMGVDPVRVELELHSGPVPDGHHRVRAGHPVITVGFGHAASPVPLVATIAHELAHVLLLGDERIAPEHPDSERLADLATVYFGMGVFGSATAVRCARRRPGMNLPLYGYALAHYAWQRGETAPDWAADLRFAPRLYLRRGLRHLAYRAATDPASAHSL